MHYDYILVFMTFKINLQYAMYESYQMLIYSYYVGEISIVR